MLRRQEHPLQKRDLLVFLVDNGGSYSKGSGSAPRGPRRSSLKFNIEPRLSEGHGGGRQSASMFGVPTSATKRQDQSIVRNTLNCCSVLYVRAVYIGTPEKHLESPAPALHRYCVSISATGISPCSQRPTRVSKTSPDPLPANGQQARAGTLSAFPSLVASQIDRNLATALLRPIPAQAHVFTGTY